MKNLRIEEIKFMPEINQIIKDNFRLFPQDITNIELSDLDEDTKESFDLIYKSKVEISVRIRNNYALKWCDFTIRCSTPYGRKTEIDKIIKGKGSIYLYAWKKNHELRKHFETWILVDINKIRNYLLLDYPNISNLIKKESISNNDGTEFIQYPIKWINKYKGLISYHNLPEHITNSFEDY